VKRGGTETRIRTGIKKLNLDLEVGLFTLWLGDTMD
jgi:hypothetical protein